MEPLIEYLGTPFIKHLREKSREDKMLLDFEMVEHDYNLNTNKTKVVITYTEAGKNWYEKSKAEYPVK